MPVADPYNEVLVAVTLGILILLVIAGLIVFMFLYYQKKKFRHRAQLDQLQKQFSEALFRSQLEIQEQTFTDISQEIHDNVGQILSLARIQMGIMTESGKMTLSMLEDVKDNVGKAIADLRDIARSLNSDRIRALSIHESVVREVERINKTTPEVFDVSTTGDLHPIDEHKKLILFRIIQEAMQNCLKHAKASCVHICFDYGDPGLEVTIRDNGVGFDPAALPPGCDGMGLSNMRARAMLSGGSSEIESQPEKGTTIKITMPYA